VIHQHKQHHHQIVEYLGFFHQVYLVQQIIIVEVVHHFVIVVHRVHMIEHQWKLVFMMDKIADYQLGVLYVERNISFPLIKL